MEVRAQLRFLRATPRKVRLVADLIRGKGVQEAVNILHLTNKHAAKPLEKLLKSAIANAENREEPVDVDRLFVKEVMVDGGPTMKRFRPAPMGRGFRVLKRSSHVTIKLDTRKSGANPGEAEKGAGAAAAARA
jgi:large subunit ribosomal protein L22